MGEELGEVGSTKEGFTSNHVETPVYPILQILHHPESPF